MTRMTEAEFEAALVRVKKAAPAMLVPIGRRSAVAINLPFPPTVNHIWQSSGKRRYLSKEYEAFLGMVGVIVEREKVPQFGKQRLSVAIRLHWPNKRRGDLDNRCKAILDSLQRAGVFDDDEQIDRLTLEREGIVKGGLCAVTIEALS